MIKNLSVPESQFSLPESLLYICKKSVTGYEVKPEIDFLLLDQQIQELQQVQSKTCQQIVEFVDEHRQNFIKINTNFLQIEQEIKNTQNILKNTIPKIDEYKIKHYSSQNKLQDFITDYEKRLIQMKLVQCAEQESEFLIEFVKQFESFINLNVEDLTYRHKYYIVRILKKSEYLKSLFQHPMIKVLNQDYLGIINLLDNVFQQIQFYLSQQLSRVISSKDLRNLSINEQQQQNQQKMTLLSQIKQWYQYSHKLQLFYQTIQQTLLKAELPTLQSILIAARQSLITGKDEEVLQNFFKNLFSLVNQFPSSYPPHRILLIIYKFLSKKQLNFLYSYVVPTFPISYNAYKQSLSLILNEQIREQLQKKHHWKLKLWAQLRIQSIMDRSAKDRQNDLNKWVDIVFKKNFMITGVKNHMVKLSLFLTNRYCTKMEDDEGEEFTNQKINRYVQQLQIVPKTISRKIKQGYQSELASAKQNDEIQYQLLCKKLEQITHNIEETLKCSIEKWVARHLLMIINNCKGSLQSFKTFIMKIVKKQKAGSSPRQIIINKRQNALKPLHGFIKNNPQLSQQSINFLQYVSLKEIEKHYDSEYAKQIYNHSKNNLTMEQMKNVMEYLAEQRKSLFYPPVQSNKEEQNKMKL